MIRAAKLESDLYEEVEHDQSATRQAATVVVVTSIASGIGFGIAQGAPLAFVLGIVLSLVGWAVYAWITYFIGTRLFATAETEADWGQLARTLGFASTPGVLLVFGVVPLLVGLLLTVVAIWSLVATVVALRAALDFSTMRAIGTALLGSIAYGIFRAVVLGV
jgi:hypothetical protein